MRPLDAAGGINKLRRPVWMSFAALALCAALFGAASVLVLPAAARSPLAFAQETFPPPPADRSLVYIVDEKGALAALPFETGQMPIKTDEVAKNDKISYVELK